MNAFSARRDRKRGSLLIVAMMLCAVIGVSLASYIQLGRTALELSNRALYTNAAMNLSENGLEEAMHSINRRVADPSYAWPGWTISGTDASRTLPDSGAYTLDRNATGIVRVHIANYLGAAPTIVTRSTVTPGGNSGRPIEKWIEVRLKKTSRFANGLVARRQIEFDGDVSSVDSWISDPDSNPSTPAEAYSTSNRRDFGSVASHSVGVNAVLIQDARIWGSVATGNHAPSVGSRGLIGPFGTTPGTVDMSRVSSDFAANYDPVAAPGTTGYILGGITTHLNLPRAGDTAAADGKFYYTASEIDFSDKAVNIRKRAAAEPAPKVVISFTNGMESIAISGHHGGLNLETGARLEIYAPGDIAITGDGVLNGGDTNATANPPAHLRITGTKTWGTQRIELAGNGVLSAVVYAPRAEVKIRGDGDVSGSVVADTIELDGDIAFHYDESLGELGSSDPFRVLAWKELTTATSRAPHLAALSF